MQVSCAHFSAGPRICRVPHDGLDRRFEFPVLILALRGCRDRVAALWHLGSVVLETPSRIGTFAGNGFARLNPLIPSANLRWVPSSCQAVPPDIADFRGRPPSSPVQPQPSIR